MVFSKHQAAYVVQAHELASILEHDRLAAPTRSQLYQNRSALILLASQRACATAISRASGESSTGLRLFWRWLTVQGRQGRRPARNRWPGRYCEAIDATLLSCYRRS